MPENTIGEVVGQTPSSGQPAEAANPELSYLDALQLVLDLAGMIPGVGAVPDLIGAGISAFRGDFIGAAISAVSAIPGAGDIVGAGKIAKNAENYAKAIKVLETKVLPKLPDSFRIPIENALSKAKAKLDDMFKSSSKDKPKPPDKSTSNNDPKNNAKVHPRKTELIEVKCFGGKQTKKNPQEYDEQLKKQEEAINNMTVDEYLSNRDRYENFKRSGTLLEQTKARADAIADMTKTEANRLIAANVSPKEAANLASKNVANQVKNMDILHSPDLVAGGTGTGTSGLGNKNVNRSIGSNWGQNDKSRVMEMDDVAKKIDKLDRKSTKMNVKLKRCP